MIDGARAGAGNEFAGPRPSRAPRLPRSRTPRPPRPARLRQGRAVEVPPAVLQQIKCGEEVEKLMTIERHRPPWRASGRTASRALAGATACASALATLRRAYTAPRADRYTLELTDLTINAVQQSKWLPLAARQACVHLQRFHRVWACRRAQRPSSSGSHPTKRLLRRPRHDRHQDRGGARRALRPLCADRMGRARALSPRCSGRRGLLRQARSRGPLARCSCSAPSGNSSPAESRGGSSGRAPRRSRGRNG